jgi:sterol desaturase/sphingolipid hydroxylase (fatty acid hydroxylase superfamily)
MLTFEKIIADFKQLNLNDPIGYAIPIFIVLILIEVVIDWKEKKHWYHSTKDTLASLAMGIGSVFINLVIKFGYFFIFYYIYINFAIFAIPSAWWSWLLLLLADDFNFYWFHRNSHQIRFMWAAHSNHHSSQAYNFAVALRQSWSEASFKYLYWLWLPLLGFHPISIFIMVSLSLIYQFFLHTETVNKLGFLEWFMNTPSHHRVHHATNHQYLDRNHAGIFIIWDRIFGTFEPESPADKPIYGLTQNLTTYNPLRIATHEYEQLWKDMQKASLWKDKIAYLFKPPGWKHDGTGKTTKELQT